MKLCRLQLSAFGPFTDHVLDFGDPARAGIHLVYGPNEAGKSSSLRAITGLFFGIPVHTDDAHLHPMKKLRVGATLALSGGEQLEIVRRKGRTRTLLDPEGNAIDEAVLQRALGGASRELFLSMFGLDHRTLRVGAEALLAGGGDVGETLFDAGGARGVHEVLAGLRTEADELFRPRGQTQKLNKAISAFKEARQRVRLRTVSGEAFHTQKQLLDEAEQERMDLQAQRQQLTAEQSELQRALAVLPHGAKRRELRERREAIGTVATLDGDTAERRVAAQRALDQGERDFQRVEAERDALEERRAELSSMPDLVAVDESVIAGIQDRLGSYRQAAGFGGGGRGPPRDSRGACERWSKALPRCSASSIAISTTTKSRSCVSMRLLRPVSTSWRRLTVRRWRPSSTPTRRCSNGVTK